MLFKKLNIALPIFILVLMNSCSNSKIYESTKPGNEIIIDGKDNDWKNDFIYDKISKFSYSIHNDDKKVFICVKISDESTKKKIFIYGMSLFIDTTGKSKEKIGIKFPLSLEEKKIKQEKNIKDKFVKEKKQADIKELKNTFLITNHEMKVKGFPVLQYESNEYSRTSSKSPIGIFGKVDINLDVLIYEIEISLSTIYGHQENNDGKILGLKITAGKLDGNKEKIAKGDEDFANRAMGLKTIQRSPDIQEEGFNAEPVDLKLKVKLK